MAAAGGHPGDELSARAPRLSAAEAEAMAERCFGVAGKARSLASERDQNFLIGDAAGARFVLKVANPGEDPAVAEMQVEALVHLARVDPGLPVPRVRPTREGALVGALRGPGDEVYGLRMVSYLEGSTRPAERLTPPTLRSLGQQVARLGRALRGFFHPAAGRTLLWDIQRAGALASLLEHVEDPKGRELLARVLGRFRERVAPRLPRLRAQVVHNDVQADNVVVGPGPDSPVTGIIDFGDMVFAPLVCDVAVCVASMMYGRGDPFPAVAAGLDGYGSVTPLEAEELELLPDLVASRLAAWVLIAAWRARSHPENLEYILHHVEEAWQALALLDGLGPAEVERRFRGAARGFAPVAPAAGPSLLERRRRHLGPTLRLSYDHPLHLVRGEGVWLYGADGRAYLDAYNNVPVVGHAHPRVVEALARQASLLNTNTRYLHEAIVELSERLLATLPAELDTCLFVNSGSEANDLAWRMAREASGQTGALVAEHAYHGITVASADLSPEEWPAGHRPGQVASLPPPDAYRGRFRPGAGAWEEACVEHVDEAVALLRARGVEPAIGCFDACFASSGIFWPPPAYLQQLARSVHAAGGLFVADEVQAGFGRTGDQLWGFQASGVVPDFVTLGKPMGNGHPVAAVVTRAPVAAAFAARYPEFFSTFGGNTVAAAVALAVLDVIEAEGLRQNAAAVGGYLREGLRGLAGRHALVGDVRGAGLMLGVELVRDREDLAPASEEAGRVVNAMREAGVLIGRTGPLQNVLKLRPPLVFSRANADLLLEVLDRALVRLG